MDNLTDLRRHCAEAMGYERIQEWPSGRLWVEISDGGSIVWQPDKDDSQLVECIEWYCKRVPEIDNVIYDRDPGKPEWTLRVDWREAIMRAVVAVGKS